MTIFAGYRNQLQRWRMMGLGSGSAQPTVVFLYRDDFPVAEAAPLTSPRTADPGPGTGTIVDTGNILDIISGEIVPSGTTTAGSDPRYLEDVAHPKTPGLCLYGKVRTYTGFGISTNSIVFGWSKDNVPGFGDFTGFIFTTGGNFNAQLSGTVLANIGTYTDNVMKKLFVVQRSVGIFLVDGDTNTLLWVDATVSDVNNYPTIIATTPARSPFGLDDFRVSQLNTPWDSDYGIATTRLAGARSAGDTGTHEADCILEFTETTVPSASQTEFHFRIQDNLNYWQVVVDSAGNLVLDEVVAGAPTQRGISAAVIADGDRIVIIAENETIKVYEANTLRITYNSAVNFKTETSFELENEGTTGAVSDIIAWPRVFSGMSLTALNNVANAV